MALIDKLEIAIVILTVIIIIGISVFVLLFDAYNKLKDKYDKERWQEKEFLQTAIKKIEKKDGK